MLDRPQQEVDRQHPLFPTYLEVEANPELLYSDHLPMMYDIPIGQEKPVRIISWNILGRCAPSGFHKTGGWETEEQARARYARIAASLVMFVNQHQPGVIVLQESYTYLFPDLSDLLPEYELKDTGKGVAMLVRKAVNEDSLVLENIEFESQAVFNKVRMQCLQKASFRRGELRININHVYTSFRYTPEMHELFYADVMKNDDAEISIVVGDTNTRVAPKDELTSMNITTGVIPMFFNKKAGADENTQMTDFPDAAFYRNNQEYNGAIQQANQVVLDYRTGGVFEQQHENDLQPKWPQFRMLMCLTDYDKESDKIQGKTVFELQEELEKQFPPASILVRKAAKDNNERGFGFTFRDENHPLCISLQQTFNKSAEAEPHLFQSIPFTDDTGRYEYKGHMFFVHKDRIYQFLEMLDSCKKDNANVQSHETESAPLLGQETAIIRNRKQRFINWIKKYPVATGLIVGAIIVAAIIIAGAVTWGVGAMPAAILGLSLGAKIGLALGIGFGTPLLSGAVGLIGGRMQQHHKRKVAGLQNEANTTKTHQPRSSTHTHSIRTLGDRGLASTLNSSSNEDIIPPPGKTIPTGWQRTVATDADIKEVGQKSENDINYKK